MFVMPVDLRGGGGSVQSPRGIAALALDPATLLDACLVDGRAGLRVGGLWQPRGGNRPTTVALTQLRPHIDSRFNGDAGSVLVTVFEQGDAIIPPPPRRLDYELALFRELTNGVATLIARIPFTGRRALLVAATPASSVEVCVIGRAPGRDTSEVYQELDTRTIAATAAPACVTNESDLFGKDQGEGYYLGGTDSLEMWSEIQVFATQASTGGCLFRFTAGDEAGG